MNNKFSQIKILPEPIPLDPPSEMLPEPIWINVNGREEHEAMLRNPEKMKSLGLDPIFETIKYIQRWGGWLNEF